MRLMSTGEESSPKAGTAVMCRPGWIPMVCLRTWQIWDSCHRGCSQREDIIGSYCDREFRPFNRALASFCCSSSKESRRGPLLRQLCCPHTCAETVCSLCPLLTIKKLHSSEGCKGNAGHPHLAPFPWQGTSRGHFVKAFVPSFLCL